MEQIAIVCTGVLAVWLTQEESPQRRKWASIFGLAGQPFWFYASWQAGQWGIVLMTLFYTVAWCKGFRNQWMKPAS